MEVQVKGKNRMVKLHIAKEECPSLLGQDCINIFWKRLDAKVSECKFIVKLRGSNKITQVVR